MIDDDNRATAVEYLNPDLFTATTVGAPPRGDRLLRRDRHAEAAACSRASARPTHLREFSASTCVVDSPGVGANLDDHVEGIVMWEAAKPMVKRSTQWWEIGALHTPPRTASTGPT